MWREWDRFLDLAVRRGQGDVTVEPVLVSSQGATSALKNSGYFHQILDLDDLIG